MARPDQLNSKTVKVKLVTDQGEVTMYLTIVYNTDGTPCETFVNCKHPIYAEHMNVFTIQTSRLLQNGVQVTEIAKDLEGVYSPVTNHHTAKGPSISLYARLGKILAENATWH